MSEFEEKNAFSAPHSIYSCVIALRMLAVKERAKRKNASTEEKEGWERICKMDDHDKERRGKNMVFFREINKFPIFKVWENGKCFNSMSSTFSAVDAFSETSPNLNFIVFSGSLLSTVRTSNRTS